MAKTVIEQERRPSGSKSTGMEKTKVCTLALNDGDYPWQREAGDVDLDGYCAIAMNF